MNDNNYNDTRYCDYFNMNYIGFQEYKRWKRTRFILYIMAMLLFSIFIDRYTAWTLLTLFYWLAVRHDKKCEEQWIKDGSITKEDLRKK